jgi:hypothetical protein
MRSPVQRLNGSTNEKYGLARSLSVMPGDKINIEVYAKYVDPNSTNWTGVLPTLMSQIASSTAGVVIDGSGYGTSTSTFPFPTQATANTSGSSEPGPKTYLNWLVFDKNYVLLTGGFDRLSTNTREFGQDLAHERLFSPEVLITEPGYVYMFLSNEESTPIEVYFDDLKVDHIKSPVIQSDDYYAFGLAFNSYQRENSTANQVLGYLINLALKSEKGAELVSNAIKSDKTLVIANTKADVDTQIAENDPKNYEVLAFNLSNASGEYDEQNGGNGKKLKYTGETVLAHELSHFLSPTQGNLLDSNGQDTGFSADEVHAVENENIVRKEMGLPERTHYAGVNVYGQGIQASKKFPGYFDLVKKKNYATTSPGNANRSSFSNFQQNGMGTKTLLGMKQETYYFKGAYLQRIMVKPLPTSQLILYEKRK